MWELELMLPCWSRVCASDQTPQELNQARVLNHVERDKDRQIVHQLLVVERLDSCTRRFRACSFESDSAFQAIDGVTPRKQPRLVFPHWGLRRPNEGQCRQVRMDAGGMQCFSFDWRCKDSQEVRNMVQDGKYAHG